MEIKKVSLGKRRKKTQVYKTLVYTVEEIVTVQDIKTLKDRYCEGMYFYVIKNEEKDFRFLYASPVRHSLNVEIEGINLKFLHVKDAIKDVHLSEDVCELGIKYYKRARKRTPLFINITEMTGKKNKKCFGVHTKRFCIDNPKAIFEYYGDKNLERIPLQIKREYFGDSTFPPVMQDLFLSTLFKLRDRTKQIINDHAIVLTQGSTGKSSLLCSLAEKTDNLSISGLYGSSDSLRGQFRAGLVEMTDKAIIIDEVNELKESSKGTKIVEIFNTPLENGVYNYRKNFSKKVLIKNQFMILSNIGADFNMEDFITCMFSNPLTIGRRFGVIVYDTEIPCKMGKKNRLDYETVHTKMFSRLCSYVFQYYVHVMHIEEKIRSKPYFEEFDKDYMRQIKAIARDIELPKARAFVMEFAKNSKRVLCHAIKLAILENIHLFNNFKSFKSIPKHLIVNSIIKNLSVIRERNVQACTNIRDHLTNVSINTTLEKENTDMFNTLTKIQKECLRVFWENRATITQKGVSYKEIKDLLDLKYFIYNLKTGRTSITKWHYFFVTYSISITKVHDDIVFRFNNKDLFMHRVSELFKKEKVFKNDDIKMDAVSDMIEVTDLV